jgi:hypothetical protein
MGELDKGFGPVVAGMARNRCRRESRLARRLSHSEAVLNQSSMQSCGTRLLYTFLLLYFSHAVKLLTILLFNFELQVEILNVSEDQQIQSTHWSCNSSCHHAPSRILSSFSLSSRRIIFWFRFYFPFFEYFHQFCMLLLKIQDYDTFPFSWLANI